MSYYVIHHYVNVYESVSYFQVRATVCITDAGTFCGFDDNVATKFEFGAHYQNQYEAYRP